METSAIHGTEKTVFSFGQTYPLKMCFEEILTIFFYKGEREREFEFTLKIGVGEPSQLGLAVISLMWDKIAWIERKDKPFLTKIG